MATNQTRDEEEVLKRPQNQEGTREPTVNENEPDTSERQPGPVSIRKFAGSNLTFDLDTLEGIDGGGDLG